MTPIKSQDLWDQAMRYQDYVYGDGRYLAEDVGRVPGVLTSLFGGKQQVDCSTFVEGLIVPHLAGWSPRLHREAQVFDPRLKFSAPKAYREVGALHESPYRPWTMFQGWRDNGGGHQFIVVDSTGARDGDHILVLEANRAYGLDGVGYRGIGPIKDFGPAPVGWEGRGWWTWELLFETYPYLDFANLVVES